MFVTLVGLAVSFFAYRLAFPHERGRRLDIYFALLIYHLMMTVAYWLLSFETAMDAFTYYRDPFGFLTKSPFTSGTYFIVHVVQAIKNVAGGSFLDHFFFFQAFGMIGIAFLLRIMYEISESLGISIPPIVYLTLFLPGLHFWSVAIGKDGPVIMCAAAAIWSVLNLRRRFLCFLLSLLLMAVIRPHIAAMSGASLVITLLMGRQITTTAKFALAPLALFALAVTVYRAQERFGVSDAASLMDFIEGQQELGQTMGSGADLQSLSYPMKFFSLMYRPLFYDAEGITELAASFENVVVLFLSLYLFMNWRTIWQLFKRVDYVSFCLSFIMILLPMLALINYNIGLGQRQKMMAMPALIVLFSTVYMYKLARRRLTEQIFHEQTATAMAVHAHQ